MVRHPAKYTDDFLPIFAELLNGCYNVLDPMAGTGKIGYLRNYGFTGDIYANEIEREWGLQAPIWVRLTTQDAAHLPYAKDGFDAICTSPTYGNRMADHHATNDSSRRNTYKHSLGRNLTEGNTGAMQWGRTYCEAHKRIWQEAHRVLKPGGIFILNIKDHIRKGKRIRVTLWHRLCLTSLGFTVEEHRKIPVTGNGFGANGNVRVDYESIIVFRKG